MAEDQKAGLPAPETPQPEPAPTEAERAKLAMLSHELAYRRGLCAQPAAPISSASFALVAGKGIRL